MTRIVAALFALGFLIASATPGRAETRIAWIDPPQQFGTHDLRVSVAGGRAVPLIFDTGSVGIRILAGALGAKVRRTNVPVTETFADHTRYDGVIAYAPVRIGDLQTPPIRIQTIDRIGCADGFPQCPGRDGIPGFLRSTHAFGTFGAGPQVTAHGEQSLMNALAALPPPANVAFVVTEHELIIAPDDTSGFSRVPLRRAGTRPDGSPAFDDQFTACFTIGLRHAKPVCSPTIFDTGYGDIGVTTAIVPQLPPLGTRVRVQVGDALDFFFRSGDRPSIDRFRMRAPPHASLGRPLLTSFDVLIDVQNGAIGFKPS